MGFKMMTIRTRIKWY